MEKLVRRPIDWLMKRQRTHREKFSGHVLNELVNPNVHWGHKKREMRPEREQHKAHRE